VERFAVLLAEDEIEILVASAPLFTILKLTLAMESQLIDCPWIKVDDPGTVFLGVEKTS